MHSNKNCVTTKSIWIKEASEDINAWGNFTKANHLEIFEENVNTDKSLEDMKISKIY